MMPRFPLLATLLFGCNAPLGPDDLIVTVSAASISAPGPQQPPVATRQGSDIEVAGTISAGSPCHDVFIAGQRSGSTVALTVTARPGGGACIAVIATFDYTARIVSTSAQVIQVAYRGGGNDTTFVVTPT